MKRIWIQVDVEEVRQGAAEPIRQIIIAGGMHKVTMLESTFQGLITDDVKPLSCTTCPNPCVTPETRYAHRERFLTAIRAMQKEMDRHIPEKGNTWEKMPINELQWLLHQAVPKHPSTYISSSHSLDIANLAVMLHLRKMEVKCVGCTDFQCGYNAFNWKEKDEPNKQSP